MPPVTAGGLVANMFEMWGRVIKNGRAVKDITVEVTEGDTRTARVFAGLALICRAFDLEQPQWLDGNVAEFFRLSRTRFAPESFIEKVDFDYLQIEITREDR